MSKVVHLAEPIHAAAKQYCQQHGLRMSEWVGQLIAEGCRVGADGQSPSGQGPSMVRKKPLQRQAPAEQGEGEASYAAPPFWAESPA